MAAIMLILSASACILCSYRRCSGGNSRASLTHHHQRRTSSQLVIKDTRLHHHHHGLLMKSSRSSMQNGNNLLHSGGYAQIIAGSQCKMHFLKTFYFKGVPTSFVQVCRKKSRQIDDLLWISWILGFSLKPNFGILTYFCPIKIDFSSYKLSKTPQIRHFLHFNQLLFTFKL